MDIRPARPSQKPRPAPKPTPAATKPSEAEGAPLKVPEEFLKTGPRLSLLPQRVRNPGKKWWIIGGLVAVIVMVVAAVIVSAFMWYNDALQPRSATTQRIHVVIAQGSTPAQIADELQRSGVIKSSFAFQLLVKQNGDLEKLQAGTYLLSPTLSARDVLNWLVGGKVDTFNVTILPGQTLAEIKQELIKDGFKAADIDAAYARAYSHPLLAARPPGVNLEGYIFPDTYEITSETTVPQLLTKTFDNFYQQIQSNNLQPKLAAHGFNIHQGVTLASIVEKEASRVTDRRQIAQVFESRLAQDMVLGSDVTFQYAASLTGQTPSPDLNSPYNTRVNKGLPPGAIANFTLDALQAVADPAPGSYLYFVAGDDGTVHYATTEQQHNDNIKQYCQKLCQ